MQARLIGAKLASAIFFIVGAGLSLPLYSQPIAYPPPVAIGMASGAQFGAQVSAMCPTIRCAGGRSFSCGAHFNSRPILAGALIGGLVGALSTPFYYETPSVPDTRSVQHYPAPSPLDSRASAAWVADRWQQQFGEADRESQAGNRTRDSHFIEGWQRFFEPSQ